LSSGAAIIGNLPSSTPFLESAMDDDTLIRNSRILGMFDQVLHGQLASLRTVELVGRGIAAEARCTQAVLEDKGRANSDPLEVAVQRGLEAADLLTGLGVIEDDLADAWRRRRANDLNDPAFEGELHRLVDSLEAWPARWRAIGPA
jgi:hypothetical protein